MLVRWCAGVYPFSSLRLANYIFKSCPKGTIARRRIFGHTFHGDVSREGPARLIYVMGERFVSEAAILRELIQPGDHVVDVGANIGYYTLLFSTLVGPKGRITAIEPSPENLIELETNVSANHLANVSIFDKAAGDRRSGVPMRAGINSGVALSGDGAFTAQMETVDDLISNRVNILKIDVEGYECEVLKGAQRVLTDDRPALFIEVHPNLLPRYGASSQDLLDLLTPHYKSMQVFEPKRPSAFLGKLYKALSTRSVYGVYGPLNVKEYVSAISEAGEPFWLVCRSV
jgi:FkbM family methyltransferase